MPTRAASGRRLLFTVPIFAGDVTVERAELDADGAIRHLEPPLFHSDPLRGEGILAFRDYRRDILQRLREAGFVESALLEALPLSTWSTGRPVIFACKAMNVQEIHEQQQLKADPSHRH